VRPDTAVPPELRALWRQRAEVLATNVASGSREHREIAHAAALIRQDYHDRFLVELLQNANDQALVGGVRDSTVVIVRTERLLAVSNGGQAVTARNLERLSSLADSDKTGVLVGNKGVGFKAVYQVTDAPEIFSASAERAGGVSTDFGVGIALEQHPFEQRVLRAAVEDDVVAFFRDNAGLAQALAVRGIENPMDAVRPELERVAGFKFPLARDAHDLAARLDELRIPDGERESIRTLVVLPLRDQRASDDVSRAIDRLVGAARAGEPGQAELALLFLAGVSKIVVIDHVRGTQWSFSRTFHAGTPSETTITVTAPAGIERFNRFWLLQSDALAGAAPTVEQRRQIVAAALREFGLEAWSDDDPLPVTIALPMPDSHGAGALGPPGRFCLGLPTQQATGLPVHVDARFFATISRTGLDFALPYNAMLLDVAGELLCELLGTLRGSPRIEERRAVTLALHRTEGGLADRAFAPGGVADGEVVLAWGGQRFLARADCRMPSVGERSLLSFVRDVLTGREIEIGVLPEEGLLADAADVLESLELPALTTSPHPWLQRERQTASVVERAARSHRADGPGYWEGFTAALLSCFEVADLQDQAWLPVGTADLAAPSQRVFLPTPVDTQADDEEVSNVPPRVAAMIRLVDGTALRIREDGRALTKLAARLDEAKLVRRPRKTELLEEALFPALSNAAEADDDLALELFAQAVSWIASMRELSRKKIDCSGAYVPVVDEHGGLSWWLADESYLGEGWGLSPDHDRLLGAAYPGRRLMPFAQLRERLGLVEDAVASWRAAVQVMGISSVPRVTVYPDRKAPLESYNEGLHVVGRPTLGEPAIDGIYQAYVAHLAGYPTRWIQRLPHDVNEVCWVDDLEVPARREAIVDLMLLHPDHFFAHRSVSLGRVGHASAHTVDAMWVFALRTLDWPVLLGERGLGREPVRVSAKKLWRLPDGARRAAYAQVLNVVPHALAGASRLLGALGVPSVEDAPLARLIDALRELAARLDDERLHTRREAQSLAIELYAQINARLEKEPLQRVPQGVTIPLLRDRRLESVDPSGTGVIVLFDDEPARARHIDGIERAYRVPVARDAAIDRLYELFVRTWGADHVVRTSTAKVRVAFSSSTSPEAFLSWLQREYPHTEVAAELAALLTFGGERLVRAEPVSRNWKAFEKLSLVFGVFEDSTVATFYDRAGDRMLASSTLDKHDVLAATWELAGARSRDLWAGYARALQLGSTRAFLHEREISDVEIIDVADAAGLNRALSVQGLAPALQAARCHFVPGTTLDEAAAWLASIGDRPDDVAAAFDRTELGGVLANALGQRSPEGEIQVVRHLGVPWHLWQEALLRRDGVRYVFALSAQRFRRTRDHLVAIVREVGAREANVDLDALSAALADTGTAPVPDAVQFVPPDVANTDEAALAAVRAAVTSFDSVSRALTELPAPPWDEELPIPKDATQRGVRLFRDCSPSARESDATTSVNAVISVAARLATSLGETVGASAILADTKLSARMRGEWAHVYAALLLLRPLIEASAPETTKKLSAVQAFRDTTTFTMLLQRLPDLARTERDVPQPKQSVLGVELTASELRADLLAGAAGSLGAKIAAAAARGIDPAILNASRSALPPPGTRGKGTGGRGGGGGPSTGQARREPELVGDLGEAFVHEWLGSVLGADYGPDCWVSKSRERYGLPAGNDGLGFDFKVPDPKGVIFGRAAAALHIEVKATSTDGSGPFPMSRAEWEEARRCHVDDDAAYVIVRVFAVDTAPRIGDVIFDPFAAHGRGEVRLADRDLWVTVAPPQIAVDNDGDNEDGVAADDTAVEPAAARSGS
jgi:hypothetical protein